MNKEELKEGMYVRIKNKIGYCIIGKIENINDYRDPMMKYCIDIQDNDFIFVPKDMIIKASHNIIDLIEVGDYIRITTSAFYEPVYYSYGKLVIRDDIDISKYTNKFIAEVITHEQIKSMSYKVERG